MTNANLLVELTKISYFTTEFNVVLKIVLLKMLILFVFQAIQQSENFQIQPSDAVKSLDTSQWPLLLKVCLLFYSGRNM